MNPDDLDAARHREDQRWAQDWPQLSAFASVLALIMGWRWL